jgi:predicted enzyme related to lactoylglutathione lyase
MGSKRKSLFTKVDCIQMYVPDLKDGIKFYCDNLGLKVIWRTDTAVGLGMDDAITEIVIQNERKEQEIDFMVDSAVEAADRIETAGGRIIFGPFDIRIGKCAVVEDPWGNRYVILDSSKGTFITDDDGNIIGQNIPS